MCDVTLSADGHLTADAVRGLGYRAAKRVLDVVVASLALVLLSPLLLALAVAIRLESPGPAIFRQRRIGGRWVRGNDERTWALVPFTLYKFRTMHVDADESIHRDYMAAYLAGDDQRLRTLRPERRNGESFKPANDARITRVGRILRKLSLDELPQLWNVVRGDMSLVGPRPPLPYEVEMYQARHLRRLASPPGLTGLAQVRGRAAIGVDDLVRLDLEYLERRSMWLDLKILVLTVPAVVTARGAD